MRCGIGAALVALALMVEAASCKTLRHADASEPAEPQESNPSFIFTENKIWEIPSIASAYLAKEMCSCLFVVGRSAEECEHSVAQGPQIARYEASTDRVEAWVRFTFGLFHNSARFEGARFGCRLQ